MADTFLVAWRRLDSLGEDPLPWLLGVARRVLANQHRAERRRGALTARLGSVLPGPAPDWDPPAAMSDELAVAMVRLSPQEREALLLVAWEGLEPGRAARAAGCSAAAFRGRLHRARRHVAAALADTPLAPLVDRRRGAMTTDDPVITELAEANPVSGGASSDPRERAEAERIMRRVLADPPPPPQKWLRPGILAPVMSVRGGARCRGGGPENRRRLIPHQPVQRRRPEDHPGRSAHAADTSDHVERHDPGARPRPPTARLGPAPLQRHARGRERAGDHRAPGVRRAAGPDHPPHHAVGPARLLRLGGQRRGAQRADRRAGPASPRPLGRHAQPGWCERRARDAGRGQHVAV